MIEIKIIKLECPHCGILREKGNITADRVRCLKTKGGCGLRFKINGSEVIELPQEKEETKSDKKGQKRDRKGQLKISPYPAIVYKGLKHFKRTWLKNKKPEKEGVSLDDWMATQRVLDTEEL